MGFEFHELVFVQIRQFFFLKRKKEIHPFQYAFTSCARSLYKPLMGSCCPVLCFLRICVYTLHVQVPAGGILLFSLYLFMHFEALDPVETCLQLLRKESS